jgi:hypothetical protein
MMVGLMGYRRDLERVLDASVIDPGVAGVVAQVPTRGATEGHRDVGPTVVEAKAQVVAVLRMMNRIVEEVEGTTIDLASDAIGADLIVLMMVT